MIALQAAMQSETEASYDRFTEEPDKPSCYSLTIFTQKWMEVRRFYVEVLGATILSERTNRYCEMVLAGLPICLKPCDFGEAVSYFHIYLSLKDKEHVIRQLRARGIIITSEGPYTNFRDPEGRVFKLSTTEAILG